ncbi:MAG: primosomal protein N', partial [Bdellovibrio sp.]
AHRLNAEQQKVVKEIQSQSGFSSHLIFGVTGSGKTEVYLELIETILLRGQQASFLVPEISLTPQLIRRFSERFGSQIAVIHSQLSPREKTDQWNSALRGEKGVLIGARSALFCPLPRLGLLILDEEHEPSFKQDEKLKYHGRDAALVLGKSLNIPVVLGSATPSQESWKNALEGRIHLHRLPHRANGSPMPRMEVVDLREVPKSDALPSWLSPRLFECLTETLERGQQAALFLNRRGIAPFVLCRDCGHIPECPDCDIHLTLHGQDHLVCHSCDYHERLQAHCSSCKEGEPKPVGLGTEQIEADVRKLFPLARIRRADRDEIQSREDLEGLIRDMESGKNQILIGTQMIAKGLDFKNLQLVGLVLADIGFSLPDFRSSERSFQLILQMAGRAGRNVGPDESPGQVLIQTYNPEHPSVSFALRQDVEGFAVQDLEARKELGYPPFGRLACLRLSSKSREKLLLTARILQTRSETWLQQNPSSGNEVLGPADSPHSRLRGSFRMQVLIKSPDWKNLARMTRQLLGDQNWVPSGVQILPDIDPLQLL